MVDVRQSSAAFRREQLYPPIASDAVPSGNGTGNSESVEPVVVGAAPADFVPVLVNAADADLLDPWMLTDTPKDITWLNYLFKKKYGPRYDPVTSEAWFRNVVLKTPLMFYPCRLANSFQISMMTCVPWLPTEFEVHVICVCAEDGAMWEAIRLMRASIAWARQRKCVRWRLSSDTEFELGGMAKRLGATEISPRYTMEIAP